MNWRINIIIISSIFTFSFSYSHLRRKKGRKKKKSYQSYAYKTREDRILQGEDIMIEQQTSRDTDKQTEKQRVIFNQHEDIFYIFLLLYVDGDGHWVILMPTSHDDGCGLIVR
jgi:hypothetical protein